MHRPKEHVQGVPPPQSGSLQGQRVHSNEDTLERVQKGTLWNSSKGKAGCQQTTQERAESWATYHRVATVLAQHTGTSTPASLSPLLVSCRNEERGGQLTWEDREVQRSCSATGQEGPPATSAAPASGQSAAHPHCALWLSWFCQVLPHTLLHEHPKPSVAANLCLWESAAQFSFLSLDFLHLSFLEVEPSRRTPGALRASLTWQTQGQRLQCAGNLA